MNSDGVLEDKSREQPDVTDEEVLTWYRNMLTGHFLLSRKDFVLANS